MAYCTIFLQVFTSIALFNMLIFPLNVFPWVINGLIEAWVSLKRVNRFLILDELDWMKFYGSGTEDGEKAMVVVAKGHFTWNAEQVDSWTSANENDATSHASDLLKRQKTYENGEENDESAKSSNTQDLRNINLTVYKVLYQNRLNI